jgi:superkiller protein 3
MSTAAYLKHRLLACLLGAALCIQPAAWAAADPKGIGDGTRPAARVAEKGADYELWMKQARDLEARQDWPRLLELGQRWLVASPSEAMAWYVQGRAYAELKRPGDAIGAYLQTLRRNPEDVYALNNLGNAYRQIGRFHEALGAYREALRIYPDCHRAWHNLGVTYYGLKGPAGVAEALKEAERINPEVADAWRGVLDSYARGNDEAAALEAVRALGRRNPEELERLFEVLIGRLD